MTYFFISGGQWLISDLIPKENEKTKIPEKKIFEKLFTSINQGCLKSKMNSKCIFRLRLAWDFREIQKF